MKPTARLLLPVALGMLAGCSEKAPVEQESVAAPAASAIPEAQAVPQPSPAPPPPTTPASTPRPAAVSPAETMDPAVFAAVREYTSLFYEGRLEELYAKFSDEMREVLTMTQLSQMHTHMRENYGAETRVIAEDTQTKGDRRGFVRWAHFDKTDEVIEVQWILRPDDVIAGFFLRPAARRVTGVAPAAIEP